MRIAFINKYQDKVARGAETFIAELSKRLSKNHKVSVISEINYLNLLSEKYDLIIPTNGRLQAVIVRIITWINGSKMVISGQSGVGFDDRINLCLFPDAFIGLSTKAVIWAKGVNPFVKTVYIPNGVDTGKFKKEDSKMKIHLPKPVILVVSAFEKSKRLNLAIKAVSRLEKGSLLLVGKGSEEKSLRRLAKKLLPGRFRMLSFSHHDMPKVYNSVDLLTYPTVPWESFGIALCEAMASSLPVVATDDPIRREILGKAGLFVDPTNIKKYAEVLEEALKKEWGELPRKQAESFSWDKIAADYEKLFQSLM